MPNPRGRHLSERRLDHSPGGPGLLAQDEHWQLDGRRMFSAGSMVAIPSLNDLSALDDSAP
jgi:hypothetical protein